jgi:hypothetical protein
LADEHVAIELIEARERILSLEADIRVYREIATAGIHALHELTTERDQLRRTVRELRESVRYAAERVA